MRRNNKGEHMDCLGIPHLIGTASLNKTSFNQLMCIFRNSSSTLKASTAKPGSITNGE